MSARRSDEPAAPFTTHIFICFCGVSKLVIHRDGRLEIVAPNGVRE